MTYDQWKTTEPDLDEPPQQWFTCDACSGEGEVFDHMHGSISSGAIDPPFDVMAACPKCNGEGGWLDDVEHTAVLSDDRTVGKRTRGLS